MNLGHFVHISSQPKWREKDEMYNKNNEFDGDEWQNKNRIKNGKHCRYGKTDTFIQDDKLKTHESGHEENGGQVCGMT